MTKNALTARWLRFVASLATVAGAAAAYVYQQGRAVAHSRHFGVQYDAADTLQSALPFALLTLVAAAVVMAFVGLAMAAAMLSVRGGILPLALSAVLMPPYGVWRTVGEVAVVTGVGSVALAAIAVAKVSARNLGNFVRRHADHTIFHRLLQMSERVDRVSPPLLPILAPFGLALAVFGAWHLGLDDGRRQAAAQSDFDVVGRDALTATVVFSRGEVIVERVLDVSPGADGKPVNRWKPGVTVRPMPDGGITYTTMRLGPTKPSQVSQP